MIAEQDAYINTQINDEGVLPGIIQYSNPVDRLGRMFNDVTSMYNELWLVRQVDMPDNILSEAFSQFNESILTLSRMVQEQASQHERDARIRAREERARMVYAQQVASTATAIPEVIVLDNELPIVRHRRRPARKSVAVKKMDLPKKMDDPCCICMDEYTRVNSVTTSCGHAFCKGCYDQHEETGLASPTRKVCCPICRSINPKITEYRARK